MNANVYVKMHNISKTFGLVKANDSVNFEVNKGEIHALLGENGAGKSTLMNMLSGIYKPDSGSIFIRGKETIFHSPKESINMGIGMIHQHVKLVDVQTATENIIMGMKGGFFVNSKSISGKINKVSEQFGLLVDPNKKVYDMSIGEKQAVEILKVLYKGADILIMDEPTAVLTPQETKKLFETMRKMANEGCAIIIITHKLNEVMEISDRVTVLRKGKTIGTLITRETSPKEMTDMMVGETTNLSIHRAEVLRGNKVLEVDHIYAKNKQGVDVLKDISFNLYEGEVVGVAGVTGSGQKELCETISGLYPTESGRILFKEENLIGLTPKDIIKRGISMSFIPEDRLGMGLVASMDMVDNFLLKVHHEQKGALVKRKPVAKQCERIIKKLNISTPGINHPIKQLSGGNIQKVLIGREIDTNPHVLITAYAVRGLDVGASHTIYDLINEQKRKGVGILFIGEDLDVLLGLCDRIIVMCEGLITGNVITTEVTKDEIGLMMAGGKMAGIKKEEVLHAND